jgi:hypothetical protein
MKQELYHKKKLKASVEFYRAFLKFGLFSETLKCTGNISSLSEHKQYASQRIAKGLPVGSLGSNRHRTGKETNGFCQTEKGAGASRCLPLMSRQREHDTTGNPVVHEF